MGPKCLRPIATVERTQQHHNITPEGGGEGRKEGRKGDVACSLLLSLLSSIVLGPYWASHCCTQPVGRECRPAACGKLVFRRARGMGERGGGRGGVEHMCISIPKGTARKSKPASCAKLAFYGGGGMGEWGRFGERVCLSVQRGTPRKIEAGRTPRLFFVSVQGDPVVGGAMMFRRFGVVHALFW